MAIRKWTTILLSSVIAIATTKAQTSGERSSPVRIQAGVGGVLYEPASARSVSGFDAGLYPLTRFNQRYCLSLLLNIKGRTYLRIGASLVGLPIAYGAWLIDSYDTSGVQIWEEDEYQVKTVFMDRYHVGASVGLFMGQSTRMTFACEAGFETFWLSDNLLSGGAGEFINQVYRPYIRVIFTPIEGLHFAGTLRAAFEYRIGNRHFLGFSTDLCYAPEVIMKGRYWTAPETLSEGYGIVEQKGTFAGFSLNYSFAWNK